MKKTNIVIGVGDEDKQRIVEINVVDLAFLILMLAIAISIGIQIFRG